MANITDYLLNGHSFETKDVASLPDRPSATMGAGELKDAFDQSSKAVLMPAINGLIETLAGPEGAANIGTADGETLEQKAQAAANATILAGQATKDAQGAAATASKAATQANQAKVAADQSAQVANSGRCDRGGGACQYRRRECCH